MPASTGATINGIAWAFRISKLTWGNEGQCVHKHETMTSKTPKTKKPNLSIGFPSLNTGSWLWKVGFVEWMSWVDSAFYDQGAIWILSRGFCQIQLHTLTAQQQLPQGNTIHCITAAGFGHHKTEEFETSAPWKRVNSGAPMCLVTWRSCKNQEAVGISSLLQCINGRGQWGQTWHYGKMPVKNQAHHAMFKLDQIRTSVKWPLYHGQMLQSALIPRPCPTYWFWMILILTKINPIAPAKSGVDAKLHIWWEFSHPRPNNRYPRIPPLPVHSRPKASREIGDHPPLWRIHLTPFLKHRKHRPTIVEVGPPEKKGRLQTATKLHNKNQQCLRYHADL